MHTDNAAPIYGTRQLEAVMAEVFKADDQRKETRRLEDREQGNGGKNHLCLLFILAALISVLTSIAVSSTYILQVCAFRAH